MAAGLVADLPHFLCRSFGELPMITQFELSATPRNALGKGASRRLRKAGQVPAILYGGTQPPQPLTLNHLELLNLMTKAGESFYSHVISLNVGGSAQPVVLRDMHRHPFKPSVMHVDFLRVSADRELRVRVPLHFINEATAPGVKQQGGLVSRTLIDVEIVCLPKDLPEAIEVDLGALHIGDALHLSNLKLPAGVSLAGHGHGAIAADQDAVVVSIQHPGSGEEATDEATPEA